MNMNNHPAISCGDTVLPLRTIFQIDSQSLLCTHVQEVFDDGKAAVPMVAGVCPFEFRNDDTGDGVVAICRNTGIPATTRARTLSRWCNALKRLPWWW